MSNELCINLAAIQVPNSAGGVNTDSDSKNDSDHDDDNSNININDNDNHDIVTTVIIVTHYLLFSFRFDVSTYWFQCGVCRDHSNQSSLTEHSTRYSYSSSESDSNNDNSISDIGSHIHNQFHYSRNINDSNSDCDSDKIRTFESSIASCIFTPSSLMGQIPVITITTTVIIIIIANSDSDNSDSDNDKKSKDSDNDNPLSYVSSLQLSQSYPVSMYLYL